MYDLPANGIRPTRPPTASLPTIDLIPDNHDAIKKSLLTRRVLMSDHVAAVWESESMIVYE
jgi:hypothetical protein